MTIKGKIAARRTLRQTVKDAHAWENWDADEAAGFGRGHNPPNCPQLDHAIASYTEEFPEVSHLEDMQRQHNAWIRETGRVEGPGCTEPPYTADLRDQDREAPDWTFTGWAEARGYSPELIDAVNGDAPAEVPAFPEYWHFPGDIIDREPQA